MNGIFPDYVGPDENTVLASLFPDWVGLIAEAQPPTGGAGVGLKGGGHPASFFGRVGPLRRHETFTDIIAREALEARALRAVRLEEVKRKIAVKAIREILDKLPQDEINVSKLRAVVAKQLASLPEGKRKVTLENVEPEELLHSDLKLRLMLLLGV